MSAARRASTRRTRRVNDAFHGKGGAKVLFDGMQTTSRIGRRARRLRHQPGDRGGNGGGNRRHLGGEQRQRHRDEHDSQGGRQHVQRSAPPALYTNEHLQSDNLTDELRARGLTTANKVLTLLRRQRDGGRSDQAGPAVVLRGGPGDGQQESGRRLFFNKTQGTPFYTPDLDRPAYRKEWLQSLRRPVDVAGVAEEQGERLCRPPGTSSYRGRGEFAAPEAYGAMSTSGPRGCFRSPGARR